MRVMVAALLLALAGCAEFSETPWEGKHRDDLVRAWGPPTEQMKLADGGARLIYVRGVINRSMTSICRMYFDTDPEGRIRSAGSRGCYPG
jgi:hypothetical protein